MKKGIIMLLMMLLSLSACSRNGDNRPTPPAAEETTSGIETSRTILTEAAIPNASNDVPSVSKEEASVVNPMQEVLSSEDFKQIELNLNMYEDESWIEVDSFYIIGGEIAEINFYDKHSDSSAYVRAAKEELGDISGLYYKFEDEETKLTARTSANEDININLKVLADGSDINGTLATWTYQGTNYFLWEDNGKKQPDTVGKLAVELAKLNAR